MQYLRFGGFGFMLLIIMNKLLGKMISLGWTSLMATIIFFGGVQLISIGLIGEYVGRLHLNMNDKPQYVIKETYNINNE